MIDNKCQEEVQLPLQEIKQQAAHLNDEKSQQKIVSQKILPPIVGSSISDENQPITLRTLRQDMMFQTYSHRNYLLLQEPNYVRQNNFSYLSLQQNLEKVKEQFIVNLPYCNNFITQQLKTRLEQTSSNYGLSDPSIDCNNVRFAATDHQVGYISQRIWQVYMEFVQMYIQTNQLQILIYTFNVIPEGLQQIFDKIIGLIEQNELEFNDIQMNEEQCSIIIEVPIKQLSIYIIICKEYEYNFKNLQFNGQQQQQLLKYPSYKSYYAPQQQQNALKVDSSSVAYQKICDLFQATNPDRQIHEILRIQHLIGWDNYLKEKGKLQSIHKDKSLEEVAQELQLYQWLCLDRQNLSQDSDRLELQQKCDQIEQQIRDQGYAYYFSYPAVDSCSGSYTLNNHQDTKLDKKVLICCLLTRDRIKAFGQDEGLWKPDCVDEDARENIVDILYGQGSLRAYPAYEIIYE